MASIEELRKDIEELKKFESEAVRSKVKNLLSVEIRKIESAISLQSAPTPVVTSGSLGAAKKEPVIYTEPIKKYAWDQSEKFMKLYVTLNGVQGLSADQVTSEFTDQSVKLLVKGLNNSNHELYIARLCGKIIPGDSYQKIKTDMVLLMMKKSETKTWECVTEAERKVKEAKKPNVDPSEDPNAGLMRMMQNMYEEGDDDMKRNIAKAWSESREKGGMPMM